ncbi:E3 ubiquitin-protein ligase synoviolin A [Chrysoperla carnea]|uniref:E3 ubiquitin-protein ligase synoviolin A n=1 Tax=Chrysoperla carnea TaxID=189513 RepID=UPI001D061466|nr:E3 ubiquitin-protein ligase synoviolin A [Chrysoperla carnea]
MKMRSIGITFVSFILTFIVVGNAYYQKKQFYPSVVYITKSNPSMAVLYIQAFIVVLLIGKLMRRVFFGQLRAAEFEHLMERSWYAVTETCLAFTVFRDDFNPKFVALFTVLLFLKSFHWLAEDRVDYMERSPVIGWIFHLRVLSLLHVLGLCDMYFVAHAYQSTITKGASVQLVFGFEYAILMTMVINVTIKYALHSVDLHSDNPWENKAVLLLYTELIMGFIKVILYISFVAIMVRIYTLPLFAFRPMYYTMRNFKKAFNDVILSRRAIRNMNTLYPDATPEELQAADNVCIICREEMVTASKKLPCNHIFHTACLRSWFQRQQTCPTCRLNILRPISQTRNVAGAQQQQRNAQPPQPAGEGAEAAANPFQMFAGVNPFHIPPMWGAPPAPPARDANNARNGASSSTTTPPPIPPQFLPPLPPFAFIPFTVPPPLPKLSTLSTEELKRLEGNEREAVEARIQLLRNIQLMLDSSVAMMQQYTFVAGTSQTTTRDPKDTKDKDSSSEEQGSSTTATSSSDSNTTSQPDVVSTSNSNATQANLAQSTEHNEIRMRRLQRFQAEQTANQQQ